ncbi:tyrosine-type recombinase/integrase [uncultured Sphingomonas sp.]|uniref:tyrosine-type recombinase/integrase n=1 Tax=uncultured Sphingomonas sp. TaxID=158754 RepID=UPI0025F5252A|nr:tyrosine-type recombinase/integrase [uncultured Sphingomonas sp.]
MAKTIAETDVSTRSKRSGLEPGKVYWRAVDEGVHLGYRKRGIGGQWLVRWYVGGQKYKQATLGTSDDVIAPGTLDYRAAERAARKHVEAVRDVAERAAAGPIATVRTACEAYMVARDERESSRRGRPVRSDAHRLERYVLSDSQLADTALDRLTAGTLATWRSALPGAVASRRRIANDFRAALNAATEDKTVRDRIAAGLRMPSDDVGQSSARPNQFLSDEQVRRIVVEAHKLDPDFGRLVLVLAATGARFAQVRRLTVGAVGADRLMMPRSFKGKAGSKPKPPVAVPVGRDVLDALRPIITGRAAGAVLLERWRHEQVAPKQWERRDRGSWATASEMTRKWVECVSAAGLPEGTVPYALRHSSIVRGLAANLPIRLVAALHDTSIAMIEAHYGAHVSDSLHELAARAVVPMVTA